jgi:hypothetical protein
MLSARRISLAVVALLALTIAIPRGALANGGVPFHASMVEHFKVVPCGAKKVCFSLVGGGQATPFGKTRETSHVVVDLTSNPAPAPGCFGNNHSNTRTVTLSGANGDEITLVLSGKSCDTGATAVATGMSRDTYVVTGGTGRYSGATGRGKDLVYIDGSTGKSATVFSGTLSTAGSQ